MSRTERARARLVASRQRLAAELERVDAATFVTRPAPGEWSASHVLGHLIIVDHGVTRGVRAASAGKLSIQSRWTDAARRLLYDLQIYRIARVRTGPALDPSEALPREEAIEQLEAARAGLLAAIAEADSETLWKQRMRHPIFGPLPVDDMLAFIAIHEDRHRMQLGRIRRALSSGARSAS